MKQLTGIIILTVLTAIPGSVLASDVEAGKSIASSVCVGCHGPEGKSINPMWPNLAGQQAGYLVNQMKDFRAGRRNDPLMAPMVKELTDQDIENIAAYYNSLAGMAVMPGSVLASEFGVGKFMASVCGGCHGPEGTSSNTLWPNLAGQQAAYLVKQLKSFRDGARYYPMMTPMAKQLTDQDIDNLAAYFSSL